MKKLIGITFLSLILTGTNFAEGDIPLGGRTCPNGQTTCLVASQSPQLPETSETTDTESSIYVKISGFLKSLLG